MMAKIPILKNGLLIGFVPFRAKGNAAAIQDLINWSDQIAGLGRETQKKFLDFCINMFRQALLLNYETPKLVYLEPKVDKFKLENFAPFVNGNNIQDILKNFRMRCIILKETEMRRLS